MAGTAGVNGILELAPVEPSERHQSPPPSGPRFVDVALEDLELPERQLPDALGVGATCSDHARSAGGDLLLDRPRRSEASSPGFDVGVAVTGRGARRTISSRGRARGWWSAVERGPRLSGFTSLS